MKAIEELLRERIGLDVAAIGPASFARLLRLRMKKVGVADFESYRRLVQSSASEWDELVEAAVVTETCFFREREPFSAFIRLVRTEWLPAHPVERLRVLSAPCASGEEPYSAAIALREAGFPVEQYQIDGIDISRRALERAESGIYRNNSFRGGDMSFRDRHFRRTEEGHQLNPSLRQNVRLRHGNLLEDEIWNEGARYDFIFCRNLLIYFDSPAQKKVLARLHRLLTPAGVLFVGPAEMAMAIEMGFSSLALPRAFACRNLRNERREQPARLRVGMILKRSLPPPVLPANPSHEPVFPGRDPATSTDLAAAGRLADEGKFKEAAEICHAYLRYYKASAQAYYLLGLVNDADRQPQAVDYYRKALYLEPNHYETLWQLALLAQNNGELKRAHVLKLRAQKAWTRKLIE